MVKVPERGFVFWPVGTGDSTTIRVDSTVFLQVDLRHMEKSEDNDDSAWPVIDELIEILPKLNQTPFLSTFALTHPDQDHCQGFAELNRRALISELWMSPRTFREFRENNSLCDDAEAFHEEAMRRVKKTIGVGGDPGRGHRIRIIGYDDLLKDNDFRGFPNEFVSVPGDHITVLDGCDHSDKFRAFVHAPFKADSFGDRNDCSLAFQISLSSGESFLKVLLLGDLAYPVIRRIFDSSEAKNLEWNILLAPHHCSKSAMYWRNEDDDKEILKEDILKKMLNSKLKTSYIIASSTPIPEKDEPGDNPPHAKAKKQYLRLAPNEFICTHEHPDKKNPAPVIFQVTETNSADYYVGERPPSLPLSEVIAAGAVSSTAPTTATGFGNGVE